jgi:hypothetical protein
MSETIEKTRISDEDILKKIDGHSKKAKNYFLASPIFIIGGIISLNITGKEFSIYSLVGIALILVFLFLFAKGITSASKATEVFKSNVVKYALEDIIDDCVYNSKESISEKRIKETGLFSGWNNFHGNDYISGTYKGHKIEISDIFLEQEVERGSGDNKKTVKTTIFKGQWMTCKLAKNLPAVIRLSESSKKGNIETENIAFNNKYSIYTDNPHYMFYVLTPHFMEYIVSADEVAEARTFFCFEKDTVHIAIYNGHDAFEMPARKDCKENFSLAREQIKIEMKYITEILDELLRNDSLF